MILPGAVSGSEGFAINFLRHQVTPAWVRRGAAAALVASLAVNTLLCAWALVSSLVFFVQSSGLRGRFQSHAAASGALQAMQAQTQALQEQAAFDLAQMNAALNLQKQHFPVGAKLAALARTLPSRIWISQVSGDRAERSIDVQAVYVIDPSAPERLPAKQWIAALQADPSFQGGLKGVDLKSSKRKGQGSSDLFLFDVSAEWGR